MVDLMIDPGHGGSDPGAIGPTGLREKDANLKIALKAGMILKDQGVSVAYTRTADIRHSEMLAQDLSARAVMANKAGARYFLSIHNNSFTQPTAKGTETYALAPGGEGEKLARAIQQSLVSVIQLPNRGVKFADFAVLRETTMPAALVEVCFISNPVEETLLKDEAFLNQAALAIAQGVTSFFGKQWKTSIGTPILGPASAAIEQAQEWARQNKAPQEFIDLAPEYWQIARERAGIDPAVAYVQFAHETGFLYRDGKSMAGIDASYHNPCGLKTTAGGGNTDPSAHKRFASWEEGITAHVDHLALYAGAKGYPRVDTPDPRHFHYIVGSVPTVEALGGKWAPSQEYGAKLLSMLSSLYETPEPVPAPVSKTNQDPKHQVIKISISGDCQIRYDDETKELIITV